LKIGRFNLSLGRVTDEVTKTPPKRKEKKEFNSARQPKGSKVDTYYAPTIKYFENYKTAAGDTQITYPLLEGLYRKTILNRVIDKLAADCTRTGYTVHVVKDGKPHKKAEVICADITKLMKRRILKAIYQDFFMYGDTFLYKQKGKSPTGKSNVASFDVVNPRYIWPEITNSFILEGWSYVSKEKGKIPLTLDEICHIPRDPISGQLFGTPLAGPILQTLNLVLNTQMNMAVVLDKLAVPLVHWMVDSKIDRKKTPMSELQKFISSLTRMRIGSDLVTDSSISAEIIGVGDKMIDFTPLLEILEQHFFVTTGVPGQIIGMSADNLSANTRAIQTYYEHIFDIQETINDYLIEDVYEPELLDAGIRDYDEIYFTYNTPQVEQLSRVAVGLNLLLIDDVIDRDEAREAAGWRGSAEGIKNGLDSATIAPPELDKSITDNVPKSNNQTKSGAK
jgi:hypothetical protein